MKPHKHSEVIKAFVDGIQCEKWSKVHDKWLNVINFYDFDLYDTVRIKPVPKPNDFICYLNGYSAPIKFTFDGETRNIKNVEIIK